MATDDASSTFMVQVSLASDEFDNKVHFWLFPEHYILSTKVDNIVEAPQSVELEMSPPDCPP